MKKFIQNCAFYCVVPINMSLRDRLLPHQGFDPNDIILWVGVISFMAWVGFGLFKLFKLTLLKK